MQQILVRFGTPQKIVVFTKQGAWHNILPNRTFCALCSLPVRFESNCRHSGVTSKTIPLYHARAVLVCTVALHVLFHCLMIYDFLRQSASTSADGRREYSDRSVDGAAHCTMASLPAKDPQRAQQRQAARLRNLCTKAIGGVVFVASAGGGGG